MIEVVSAMVEDAALAIGLLVKGELLDLSANKGLSSQGYGFSSSHVWM